MAVATRTSARRNYRSYVDLSKFTSMEIEHKHDTGSVIPHEADGHLHPDSLKDFAKVVN